MDDPFGFAKFDEINACLESRNTFDRVHYLARTPLEECHDIFMHEESPRLGCDNVLPSPLDHSHVYNLCSQPSLSSEFDFDVPIDNHMFCDSNVDLGMRITCLICLVGMLLIFCPYVTLLGMMPPLTHMTYV